jgi:hypothetical protein
MSSPASNWPHTIREINDLPVAEKCAIYQTLIPEWVFPMFGIDPKDNTVRGTPVVHKRCPHGSSTVEISVYNIPESTEPVLYLQMGDTFNSQLIVLLVVVNDPTSPRYNVDVDENGQPNQLGTRRRNISEEIRAMEAGLTPGQVRRGLRVFRTAVPVFENFVARMGHSLFLVEPLFYHNAVTFERYGFAYSRGFQTMKLIHSGFLPGGVLRARLDGSTPFRRADAWKTVTGRSWAIHDGILGDPFVDVQMYKHLGHDAGIETFPNATW